MTKKGLLACSLFDPLTNMLKDEPQMPMVFGAVPFGFSRHGEKEQARLWADAFSGS